MAMKCKFQEAAQLLESRILHGNYLVGELPSERSFADEVGISHMTARKAMRSLEGKGLLVRRENGRLTVNSEKRGFFGIVVPDSIGTSQLMWRKTLSRYLEKIERCFCWIEFSSLMVGDSLGIPKDLSGIFLIVPDEGISEKAIEQIHKLEIPVVVLGEDYSEAGLRSIVTWRRHHIQNLLDYIAGFGHERIDCLNVDKTTNANGKNLAQWNLWKATRNCEGELYDRSFWACKNPQDSARDYIKELVTEKKLGSSAILCSSEKCALGVMRALWENGITPGKDISIASIHGDSGLYETYYPSLCCLQNSGIDAYLKVCVDWMLSLDKKWIGSLLLAPDEPEIFRGESVSACLSSKL